MPVFEKYAQEHPEAFHNEHLFVQEDLSNLWDVLQEHGVAILPGVLSPEECDDNLQHVHRFYENLTRKMKKPYNHEDPSTYKTLGELHKLHSMLFQSYGVGQCQGSWNVRQNPKIFEAFKTLWQDEDLLTSMDGLSYQIAPERVPGNRADSGFFKNTWFHTDQSYSRNDLECIQGQVPLLDVAPGDATLMVLEGSHRFHKAFAERFGSGNLSDWFLLESGGKDRGEGYKEFYKAMGCTERRISCPRGSLILWDSRTIHCGSEPLRNRPNSDHWRAVIYVCMTPRKFCTEDNMNSRIRAFQELQTTSHWPHRINIFRTLQTGMFVTHPKDINLEEQQHPHLTELGKRLLVGADNADQFDTLIASHKPRDIPIVKPNGRPESMKDRAARLAKADPSAMDVDNGSDSAAAVTGGKVKAKRATTAEDKGANSKKKARK